MFKIGGVRPIIIALAAAVLVTSCDGCHKDQGNRQQLPVGDSTPPTAKAPEQYSVVFQLTGQLLILPPSAPGGETNVLLPLRPASRHNARLGFGIPKPPETPDFASVLCDTSSTFGKPAINVGICYVDLHSWHVAAIGTGGTSVTVADLEQQHVPNLTKASGNRVPFDALEKDSMIVFAGGAPGRSCALGEWDFERGGGGSSVELANMLPWVIKVNQGTTFTLTFTRAGEQPITVQPLGQEGNVAIVLANVMDDELKHLPPAPPPEKIDTPTDNEVREHFDAYYELFDFPAPLPQNDINRRPRPLFSHALVACHLDVGALVVPPEKRASIGTYACMPATGVRYP